MLSVPYERIIQWTAGPVAIAAGWASTFAESHFGILNSVGLGHTKQAALTKGIVIGLTFVVSTGVTYAAHHKWLDNAAKWWDVVPKASLLESVGASGETPSQVLAGIESATQAALTIQATPGTDAATITAGLAPHETVPPAPPTPDAAVTP